MCWCVEGIYSVLHILPQDITNTIQRFSKKEYDICSGCLYSNVFPYSHCSNIIILYHLIWSFTWFIFFLVWFVAAQQYMRRDKKRRYNSSFKLDWDDEAAQRRQPERKGEMTWRTTLFRTFHSFYCVTLACAKPYLPSILIRGLAGRSRPVSATEDEAVVCHVCSGVSGGWSAVFKESRSVRPGLRRMDIWCCSLQTGWMTSVFVLTARVQCRKKPKIIFLKPLLFRQWSPIAVVYQPVVQLLSKP